MDAVHNINALKEHIKSKYMSNFESVESRDQNRSRSR